MSGKLFSSYRSLAVFIISSLRFCDKWLELLVSGTFQEKNVDHRSGKIICFILCLGIVFSFEKVLNSCTYLKDMVCSYIYQEMFPQLVLPRQLTSLWETYHCLWSNITRPLTQKINHLAPLTKVTKAVEEKWKCAN